MGDHDDETEGSELAELCKVLNSVAERQHRDEPRAQAAEEEQASRAALDSGVQKHATER